MSLAGELAKYAGGELAKAGSKELAKAGASSMLSSLVPSMATKVGTEMATKAGADMATKGVLNSLVPSIRTNWNGAGDIEGMLNGKFLGTNDYYFPSTFSEGALGRATYGPDQPIDQKKVAGLVRAIKNNEDIAPIAGFKNDDGLIDIYDGHHRLAAYQKAGKMPRVKLFTRETKDQAYTYADEWAKNAAKDVQQYLPAKPEAGLDEYGMGTIDLRDLNTPKVQQSIDDVQYSLPEENGKFDKLLNKAKNYKSLERFEKMNNPIKGSEIWGEKPKGVFERDSRAVRINMFPNEATKGTGITKQYLLNLFKDAYDQGITDIVPSYGSYTKEGASFMDHLAEQGWVKATGRNGWNSYEIAPKIAEWEKTTPLRDIFNEANNPSVSQSLSYGGYNSLANDAKRIGSAEVAPIDPETLPGGYDKMRDYLADYKNIVPKAIGKPASKVTKADLVKLLEDYGYDTEGTKWELWNNAQDALEDEFIDELYENNGEIFARFLGDHRGGAGITGPGQFKLGSGNRANYLDSVYSDRLGIGRSHTPMADSLNKYNRYGMDTAGGDYMTNGIGINLNSWGNEGEGGVSTIAHERMHAWQDQGTGWNYPEEFRDAYTELRKDLEPYFHDDERILKDHPNSNRELDYWARKNEQEARMLQSYLENEGFTKTGRKPEWGNEIKPAFDKFYKKLRELSKKGVALPAIAGLFGLGAISSKKDGKKLDNIE